MDLHAHTGNQDFMMGFQFAAGCRQAAFNNFLMEAWRPTSAPATRFPVNVETLILTGVVLKINLLFTISGDVDVIGKSILTLFLFILQPYAMRIYLQRIILNQLLLLFCRLAYFYLNFIHFIIFIALPFNVAFYIANFQSYHEIHFLFFA